MGPARIAFAWLGDLPDGAPGATGLAITQQTKRWVILIHPGALPVYRAVGNWSDVDEAYNNNKLLTGQKVLVQRALARVRRYS